MRIDRGRLLSTPSIPHELVLKYCSCVVYHGSAGTLARCIEAAVPVVVVPILPWSDQIFFGERMQELGAGELVLPRASTPGNREEQQEHGLLTSIDDLSTRVSAAIQRLVGDQACAGGTKPTAAAAMRLIRARMSLGTSGVERAVRTLEHNLLSETPMAGHGKHRLLCLASHAAEIVRWLGRHPYHRVALTLFWVLGCIVRLVVALVRLLSLERCCPRRTPACVLSEAEAESGCTDYGESGEREAHEAALSVLMPAFQEWSPYGPLNKWSQKLAVKLRVVHLHRQLSSIAPEPPRLQTQKTVFIVSMPRAGSTLMHRLMALDPKARVMRSWELRYPLPPPEPESSRSQVDPRIECVRKEFKIGYALHPLIDAIHHVDADGPDECVNGFFPDYAFPTFSWGAERMDEAFAWYTSNSMDGQYTDYRRVLDVLCSRMPPASRTVLKSPHHLFHLRTIARTFPGASFVWLHRDPRDVVRSCCLMNLHVHEYTAVDFVAPSVIGRRTLSRLAAAVNAAESARHALQGAGVQIVDVYYPELISDPSSCCERVYSALGYEWRPELSDAIREHLAGDPCKPPSGAGAHSRPRGLSLSLGDFGLLEADVDAAFEGYLQRHARSLGLESRVGIMGGAGRRAAQPQEKDKEE
jgi:hypothetical protein